MTVVPRESRTGLIAGTRGVVHARPGGGPFNAARTSARLGHQTRFPGRFSAGPLSRIPAGRLTQAGAGLMLPEPAEKPTAPAAVSVTVRSSLTPQHGRSPNGTDNS
jgi:sugar/nucleoside kinase (ribokinase family)